MKIVLVPEKVEAGNFGDEKQQHSIFGLNLVPEEGVRQAERKPFSLTTYSWSGFYESLLAVTHRLSLIRGRCYDHNFMRFLPFSAKMLAFF
jgi:hypothetical protein